MRKQFVPILIGLFILSFPHLSISEPEKHEEMPPVITGSTQLQQMKTLVGHWKGIHKMGEMEKPVEATYEITSNGSVVLERTFPGTPHEMVTTYHDKKDKLTMTHYCSLGNQPNMNLTQSTDTMLIFDFSEDNFLDPATEDHMHSLKITFNDDGSLTHSWGMYQNGEESMTTQIHFTKVEE